MRTFLIVETALRRDDSKIYALRGLQAPKSTIDVYSYAGSLIQQISLDRCNVQSVGWSEDEKLLVITDHDLVAFQDDDDLPPLTTSVPPTPFGAHSFSMEQDHTVLSVSSELFGDREENANRPVGWGVLTVSPQRTRASTKQADAMWLWCDVEDKSYLCH